MGLESRVRKWKELSLGENFGVIWKRENIRDYWGDFRKAFYVNLPRLTP